MSSVCPTEGLICCTRQGGLCSRSQTVTGWFTEQVSSLTSLRGSVARGSCFTSLRPDSFLWPEPGTLGNIRALQGVGVYFRVGGIWTCVCVCWLERFTNQTVPWWKAAVTHHKPPHPPRGGAKVGVKSVPTTECEFTGQKTQTPVFFRGWRHCCVSVSHFYKRVWNQNNNTPSVTAGRQWVMPAMPSLP